MVRVHLQRLLRDHVCRHRRITKRLRLHDALHVRAPAVLAGNDAARRANQSGRDGDLLHRISQSVLDQLAQIFVLGLELLELLLLIFRVLKFQTLLRQGHQLLAIVLLKLLNGVLVNRVNHVKDLVASGLALLQERRILNSLLAFASNVINVFLILLHAADVLLERGYLLSRFRRVVPEKISKLRAIGRIFMNAEFDILGEVLIEFLVVLLVLRRSDVLEELQTLLNEVFPDNFKDLVLL
mmetsp:Transcript_20449/g.35155  ORF Transcript_20449/g.35155 Transcript_20449/m.35155 type:complete len:240 (-) Transcript_20449:1203-1922(-)